MSVRGRSSLFVRCIIMLNVDETGWRHSACLKDCIISVNVFIVCPIIKFFFLDVKHLMEPPKKWPTLIYHSLSTYLPPAGHQESWHCLQTTRCSRSINSPPLNDAFSVGSFRHLVPEFMWSKLPSRGNTADMSFYFSRDSSRVSINILLHFEVSH